MTRTIAAVFTAFTLTLVPHLAAAQGVETDRLTEA